MFAFILQHGVILETSALAACHCELGAAFCTHAGVQEMHTQPRTCRNLVLPLQRPAFHLSQARRVRAHPSPRSRCRCWRADRRLPHSQTRARRGTPPSPPPRPLSPVRVERHDIRSDGGFVNHSVLFLKQIPHCLHVHWLLCATAPCGRWGHAAQPGPAQRCIDIHFDKLILEVASWQAAGGCTPLARVFGDFYRSNPK